VNLEACLPDELRARAPTISRIAAGMSGAGVYRVSAGDDVYVLKVTTAEEPLADWQRKCRVLALAAGAGIAPRVIHVDEARRAILSAFVVDRGLPTYYGNPATHAAAVIELAKILRRAHDLPPPPELTEQDPRQFLTTINNDLASTGGLPEFVREVNLRVIGEPLPAHERAPVLSHNDVNPSNLIYDGQQIMLLDWDMAGLNDDYYDLAAIAMFLRMNEPTCLAFVSAHDGVPVTRLPPRFAYNRRLVAALCGTIFLHLARTAGHPGPGARDTLEATATLAEVYPRMRSGELDLSTADGRWLLGLALVKESTRL
jgi:aminoglycoside phosphotransferase (APT) family kinase protein